MVKAIRLSRHRLSSVVRLSVRLSVRHLILLSQAMRSKNQPVMSRKPVVKVTPATYPTLLTGIGALLEESRRSVARAANCFMTATYWEIGRRIVDFEQGGKKRAEYGEELLKRLAVDLTAQHGRGSRLRICIASANSSSRFLFRRFYRHRR